MRNVIYQTEWQQKSAGSFIPKLSYRYIKFSNSGDLGFIENAYDLQLAASYYYTWVIRKNWFISFFLSPSLGIRWSNYKDIENGITVKDRNRYLLKELENGMQLRYSSKYIIFGASIDFNENWYDNEDSTTIIKINYMLNYI